MWRALVRLARSRFVPGGGRALSLFLRLYYIARFLRGKIDLPYFELVITTKCTLHCAACANMMQYFDASSCYTCSFAEIKKTLEALLGIVDSVLKVRIIGGEPLLHKDLSAIVRLLRESPKVKSFDIVTNGTLNFSEDVLDALEGTYKAGVDISDYSASPNLKLPLRHEAIIASLKERGIACNLIFTDAQSKWWDPDRIYKRGRAKEDVVRNFRACMMACVSVMSCECAKDAELAPLGAAFICPTASALSRLKGLGEFEGDYIDLASATRERIIEFYAQDYFKACDYCQDKWEGKRLIPVAVQTREVFSLLADQ